MALAHLGPVRVLLIGHQQFVPPLRATGHEVIDAFTNFPDLCRPGQPFDATVLWPLVGAADAVLVTDMLGPQALPHGLERLPAPCGYYAIDTHVNWFWQRHYAQLFDLVFAAQRDYVPLFRAEGVAVEWLPWGADASVFVDRDRPRSHDLVFVGTDDGVLRPKRRALLAHLRDRFDLITFGTNPTRRLSWEELAVVYGTAKIVINEAIFGDLTFRVFEAMACGALLLTEATANGLEALFTPGEHLDTFDPGTIDEVVSRYLDDDSARARVARAGRDLVHAHHRLDQRMERIVATTMAAPRRSPSPATAARAWGTAAHLLAVRGLMDPQTTLPAATAFLHRAHAAEPRADVLITLAETCVLMNQSDFALALCAEARRIQPDLLSAWLLAAQLHGRRGESSSATALAREGLLHAEITPADRGAALDALPPDCSTADWWTVLGRVVAAAGMPILPGLVSPHRADVARTAVDYAARAAAQDQAHRGAAELSAEVLEVVGLRDLALTFRMRAATAAPDDPVALQHVIDGLEYSYQGAVAARLRASAQTANPSSHHRPIGPSPVDRECARVVGEPAR
jgi:Glycosyl transferases group 1